MINNNYYYFISGLPDITFNDTKQVFDLREFRDELKLNLAQEDYKLIEIFFNRFDNLNILNILEKKDVLFNNLGIFTSVEIDEEIKRIKDEGYNPESLFPEYLQNFVAEYLNDSLDKSGTSIENQLSLSYFNFAINSGNSFVNEYYQFELNLLNFMTAFLSRKYELDFEKEILGENDITLQLKKSNARDFNISNLFDFTGQLLQIADLADIIEREKKIDLLRWEYLEGAVFFHYFTIEKIFAYMVKLGIINRWLGISKETGKKEFENAVNNLQSGYEFPEEYRKV